MSAIAAKNNTHKDIKVTQGAGFLLFAVIYGDVFSKYCFCDLHRMMVNQRRATEEP